MAYRLSTGLSFADVNAEGLNACKLEFADVAPSALSWWHRRCARPSSAAAYQR